MGVMKVIALVVVIVLALCGIAIGALRYRKLRRDDQRAAERRRHATAVIASPYLPLGGIHILDDGEEPVVTRSEPVSPRLTPLPAEYGYDARANEYLTGGSNSRHDDQWALERSFHRSRLSASSMWVLLAAFCGLLVLVAVGAYLQSTNHSHSGTTTTTSTVPTTTTVASGLGGAWPTQLVDYQQIGSEASYRVPAQRYHVSVRATSGNEWLVIEMRPTRTLEFQGLVTRGSTYSLALTGEGFVILGSPSNATVSVNRHAVVMPAHVSAPMTLSFTPAG